MGGRDSRVSEPGASSWQRSGRGKGGGRRKTRGPPGCDFIMTPVTPSDDPELIENKILIFLATGIPKPCFASIFFL